MRGTVSETRLSVWITLAIATTVLVIAACTWVRRHPVVGTVTTVLAGVALGSVGSVAGLSTWVSSASRRFSSPSQSSSVRMWATASRCLRARSALAEKSC